MVKLLFFGDSLTDLGRNRNKEIDNYSSYGGGYVFEIAAHLMYEHPGEYKIVNRGISGNKVTDLFARYQEDVVDEKPDVLTILIGVNDLWHEIAHQNGTPIDVFEQTYLKMVLDIKEKLSNIKIIIMEPFYFDGAATHSELERFKEISIYIDAIKRIVQKTGSIFIPLQKNFDNKIKNGGSTQILYDGIHTNPGGARLIALKWLETYKKIA